MEIILSIGIVLGLLYLFFSGNNLANKTPEKTKAHTKIDLETFYNKSLQECLSVVQKEGYVNSGIVDIPALDKYMKKTIDTFFNDPYFNIQFGSNLKTLCFVVTCMCWESGVVFASKWNTDKNNFTDEYVEQIYKKGPPQEAEPIVKQYFQLEKQEINLLCKKFFDAFIKLYEYYNPQEEYLKQIFSISYKLGISMLLDKQNMCKENTKIISPNDFYEECICEYHKIAKDNGFAQKDLIFIPELLMNGNKMVLSFLKSPGYEQHMIKEPVYGYLVGIGAALFMGIIAGYQWHIEYSKLEDMSNNILAAGDNVPVYYKDNFEEKIGIDTKEILDFSYEVYEKFLKLHEPYWKLKDPRNYTFNGMLASYQLGISIVLANFGY